MSVFHRTKVRWRIKRPTTLCVAILACQLVSLPVGADLPSVYHEYAFDSPRLLTRQIQFGLAHAIDLLGRTCLDRGKNMEDVRASLKEWQDRHLETIKEVLDELSAHYFAGQTNPTTNEAIARTMHLPPQLDISDQELDAGCASFSQAVASPRYDLDLNFAMRRDQERLRLAIETRELMHHCWLNAPNPEGIESSYRLWHDQNLALELAARERAVNKFGTPEFGTPDHLTRYETNIQRETLTRAQTVENPDAMCPLIQDEIGRGERDLARVFK